MVRAFETDDYKGYGKCLVITNGVIEAYVTIEKGPRIIRFGFIDRVNIFADDSSAFTPVTDEEFENYYYKGAAWNNYGGHRLWLSPEYYPQTYYPDNDAVDYTLTQSGAVFTPAPQTQNGVALQIELKMDPDDANMKVIHKIKNIGTSNKEFAPWALSVCGKGGIEIIPLNTNNTGYLHNKIIAVWHYNDMKDSRVYWGNKYVTVYQKDIDRPLKLGFDNNAGKAYYVIGDTVFCKSYKSNHKNGRYPDGGVSYETYTCKDFTELETLGELKEVAAGETVEHTEFWSLMTKPCAFNERDDESIENFIKQL